MSKRAEGVPSLSLVVVVDLQGCKLIHGGRCLYAMREYPRIQPARGMHVTLLDAGAGSGSDLAAASAYVGSTFAETHHD